MKKISAILVLASGFLIAAKPATAADYLFLKLPGITGPSTIPPHGGEIEVLSFSAGASAKKGVGSTCSDLSVMKITDQTSPLLFVATVMGVDFAQATLTYAQGPTGGPVVDKYSIVLNNASITSVQDSGTTGGGGLPIESVSLKGTSWVVTFYPAAGPPVTSTLVCK